MFLILLLALIFLSPHHLFDSIERQVVRAKDKGSQTELGRPHSASDIRRCPKIGTSGPYEMLVKERLMGIYLAVFVHRDVKYLVRPLPLTVRKAC